MTKTDSLFGSWIAALTLLSVAPFGAYYWFGWFGVAFLASVVAVGIGWYFATAIYYRCIHT